MLVAKLGMRIDRTKNEREQRGSRHAENPERFMCQVATSPGIQKAAIRITASSVVTKCSIEWVRLTLPGSKQAQVGG